MKARQLVSCVFLARHSTCTYHLPSTTSYSMTRAHRTPLYSPFVEDTRTVPATDRRHGSDHLKATKASAGVCRPGHASSLSDFYFSRQAIPASSCLFVTLAVHTLEARRGRHPHMNVLHARLRVERLPHPPDMGSSASPSYRAQSRSCLSGKHSSGVHPSRRRRARLLSSIFASHPWFSASAGAPSWLSLCPPSSTDLCAQRVDTDVLGRRTARHTHASLMSLPHPIPETSSSRL